MYFHILLFYIQNTTLTVNTYIRSLESISGILNHLGFGNRLGNHDSMRDGNWTLSDNRLRFDSFLVEYSARNLDNLGSGIEDGTRYLVSLFHRLHNFARNLVILLTFINNSLGNLNCSLLCLIDSLGDLDGDFRDDFMCACNKYTTKRYESNKNKRSYESKNNGNDYLLVFSS